MKLALIALGLLATTGVVFAACIFCPPRNRSLKNRRLGASPAKVH